MMQHDYILILQDTLKDLDESRHWLKRSYDICKAIGIKDAYSEDEFDAFETLTGRFSRTCKTLNGDRFQICPHDRRHTGG
jgi:hypothetical protein